MKIRGIFLSQTIAIVTGVVFLCGCQENQQVICQQEKIELQKTVDFLKIEVDSSEVEIAGLKYGNESVILILLETTTKLKNCQKQLEELKKEKAKTTTIETLKAPVKRKKMDYRKGIEELKAAREAKIKRLKAKNMGQTNTQNNK